MGSMNDKPDTRILKQLDENGENATYKAQYTNVLGIWVDIYIDINGVGECTCLTSSLSVAKEVIDKLLLPYNIPEEEIIIYPPVVSEGDS
jgi:hypothetical protein